MPPSGQRLIAYLKSELHLMHYTSPHSPENIPLSCVIGATLSEAVVFVCWGPRELYCAMKPPVVTLVRLYHSPRGRNWAQLGPLAVSYPPH